MDFPVYDSRDLLYKTPYGAVPCGTRVTLTLRPLMSECFSRCAVVLYGEFADHRQEITLERTGCEEDRDVFTCTYEAPAQPELIWYCFNFRRTSGETVWMGRNGYCGEGESVCWQQTVYDDTLSTPDWFGRGVTYQIFPDRFHRPCIPNPAGMLGDRKVHQDWNELMDYLPDEHGEIRNRDFFGGNLAGITEKLDYEQIARQAALSSYHFQRVFGILCGYTLGEYIRNRRLALAGEALSLQSKGDRCGAGLWL